MYNKPHISLFQTALKEVSLRHSCTTKVDSPHVSKLQKLGVKLENSAIYRKSSNKNYVLRQLDWTKCTWTPGDASLPAGKNRFYYNNNKSSP